MKRKEIEKESENELYSWKMMWFNQLYYYTRDSFDSCRIQRHDNNGFLGQVTTYAQSAYTNTRVQTLKDRQS